MSRDAATAATTLGCVTSVHVAQPRAYMGVYFVSMGQGFGMRFILWYSKICSAKFKVKNQPMRTRRHDLWDGLV
jgi:hypothetical protein